MQYCVAILCTTSPYKVFNSGIHNLERRSGGQGTQKKKGGGGGGGGGKVHTCNPEEKVHMISVISSVVGG